MMRRETQCRCWREVYHAGRGAAAGVEDLTLARSGTVRMPVVYGVMTHEEHPGPMCC
jgi:hypothetical protein